MFLLICKKSTENILPMAKFVAKTLEPYQGILKKGNDWVEAKKNNNQVEDIYIKSFDGLKLHAIFIERSDSKGIFIECHGYRSTASRDLYASCSEYYNMGYSLLVVDNRTCDKSDGKYITFGVNESKDVVSWIKYLNVRFPAKSIVLAGVSMGATTVLMALKDISKKMNVKCVIADCGYVSPYDEVLYCIKHYFHINGKLFIDMINLWCKMIAKFSLKEISTILAIKNTKIPILFIHGLDDDFVLPENSRINYSEYGGKKEIQLFENASHGISYLVDSKRYMKIVKNILSK